MSDHLQALAGHVQEKRGGFGVTATIAYGELTLSVPADSVVGLLQFLRDDVPEIVNIFCRNNRVANVGMPTNGIPYPLFVMSGLIVWLFVAQSFPVASASIPTTRRCARFSTV